MKSMVPLKDLGTYDTLGEDRAKTPRNGPKRYLKAVARAGGTLLTGDGALHNGIAVSFAYLARLLFLKIYVRLIGLYFDCCSCY